MGRIPPAIDQEEFVTGPFARGKVESGGVGEKFGSGAITEGGGEGAAEDQGAPGQVQFIDETGLEKGIVQATATLDHDGADMEVAGKGNQPGVEIDGIPGGNKHMIGEQT